MRPSRALLTVAAIAGVLFLGTVQTIPATAEAVHEQVLADYVAPHQSLAVSPDAVDVVMPRDAFTITAYTVVQWPVCSCTSISDGFGYRDSSIGTAYHLGVDMTTGDGTPIAAIADGIVSQAGYNGAYGNSVTLEHVIDGQTVTTVYGHMQDGSVTVAAGQAISRGTIVGLLGSTGVSSGPHLHFEVHVDGVPIDPYAWISAHANI